jgi:hypothetical protein
MSRVDDHSDFYRFFAMSSNKENSSAAAAVANNKNNNNGTATAGGGNSPKSKKLASASTSSSNTTIMKGGFTLDRINDILDFETEHIMMTRENRQEHFDAFLVRLCVLL